MPSHLTRQVFRRLLANEPLVHRGCLRQQAYHARTRSTAPSWASRRQRLIRVGTQQQRTFFNFNMFGKSSKDTQEAEMDPGLQTMMDLEKFTRMRARLPAPQDVAKGFDQFFKAKFTQKRRVEDTHARLALQSLRHVLQAEADNEVGAPGRIPMLSINSMERAMLVLRGAREGLTEDHSNLAKAIYDRLWYVSPATGHRAFRGYVEILARAGRPEAARTLLIDHDDHFEDPLSDEAKIATEDREPGPADSAENRSSDRGARTTAQRRYARSKAWAMVLEAYVVQGDRAGVLRTLEMIRERDMRRISDIPMHMLRFCMDQEDEAGVQTWWNDLLAQVSSVAEKGKASERDMQVGRMAGILLPWCLRTDRIDTGHAFVRDMMLENPPKLVWDAILVWAAGTGKGADEIGRMMDVMEQANTDLMDKDQWRRPDITTINSLLELAVSRDDPYMAERFIVLGRDRGIEPDARTYVLQMEYRLHINDVDGALIAYKNLQATDVSSEDDVPTVNKLIVALCNSKRHDFDTAMNVAADLSDRKARFEPGTVTALSLLHFSRDELHDVVDLLNTHALNFSTAERKSILDSFTSLCLDPATPVSRVWDAYSITRKVFDELNRDARTTLIQSFYSRGRPDMAVHVFQHMRMHSRADTMPTDETYITTFLAAALVRDLESLEVIHNQLKLDYNINVTTRIRNALIKAYTACGEARRGLQFWDEIVASKEGPSYNSLHIALRACERSPWGDEKAREIWAKLRKLNIELDPRLWASYIAALGGLGKIEQAVSALEKADGGEELEVDAFVIGTLNNIAPGPEKQAEVEAWARSRYPAIWQELEEMPGGRRDEEVGMRWFGIERDVPP